MMLILQATEAAGDPSRADYGLAGGVLLAAFAVLAVGFWFAHSYHKMLFDLIPKILPPGAPVSGQDVGAFKDRATIQQDSPGGLKVLVEPDVSAVTTGQQVKFTVLSDADSTRDLGQVQWTVSGADTASETGPVLVHTFAQAGAVTVTASGASNASWVRELTVTVAATKGSEGIVLPFAIGNWGRLVVSVLGVGVIAALMLVDVVSEAAGIGVLGALLGAGVAAGSSDKTSTSTDASSAPVGKPQQPAP